MMTSLRFRRSTQIFGFVFGALVASIITGGGMNQDGHISMIPMALAFSGSGSGTSASPYIITTCSQVAEIGNAVSAYYQLGGNINCGSYGNFTPISSAFTGTLDGQWYTISNLTIANTGTETGIFKYTLNATIKNLQLQNEIVSSTNYFVGGITGFEEGGSTFSKVAVVSSTIKSTYSGGVFMGGFIGAWWASGATTTISDSYVASSTIADANGSRIGGLIGDIDASGVMHTVINRSYATGVFTGSGDVAGLVGFYYNGGSNETLTINDSFGAASSSYGLVGFLYGGSYITLSDDFWDARGQTTSTEPCVYQYSVSGCTAINTASVPNTTYFFNTSSTTPFTNWNFASTWQVATAYPQLQFQPASPIAILHIATSTALSFAANVSSTATSSAAVIITNTGAVSSTLNWSASSTQSWLTFSASSGSLAANASTSMLLIINPSGLSGNTYNATATISDPSASSSPQYLSVSLTINQAILSIATSTALQFTAVHGAIATSSQSIVITNAGAASTTLNWSATSTQPWLAFGVNSGSLAGGVSSSLVFITNPSSLAIGSYNATATISDPNASSSPQNVAVLLTVSSSNVSTTMASPTNGTTVSSTITVAATATSTAGIATVQFYLDGSTLGSAVTSSPYQVVWDTMGSTNNATHTLYALATDDDNNTATSTAVIVTVANPASQQNSSSTPSHSVGTVIGVPASYAPAGYQPLPNNVDVFLSELPPEGQVSTATTSIASLESELASLETELHILLNEAAAQGIVIQGSNASPYVFTRNLFLGSRGSDVASLQHYLNTHGYPVNATPTYAGSLGYETSYFGMATEKALSLFQKAHGITPSYGYFGPKTRGWVNAHP